MSKTIVSFKPLSDRVLVKRVEKEEKTAGGIIIPDTAKEKPQMATVIEVGPGAISNDGKLIPMSVKSGDTILLGKWGGTEVTLNNEEYVVIKESEILGIVNEGTSASCGTCPAGCHC